MATIATIKQIQLMNFIAAPVLVPNAKTERCGRPKASELATDVARPHSLQ